MPSTTIISLAREVSELREKTAEAKAIHEELKQQQTDKEMNLFQQMEIEGVPNFKLEGIGTIYKSTKPWATVVDIDRAKEYFKQIGIFDEVFQLKATAKRMNEYIKENYLEVGKPIPEENIGVAVTLKQGIGIRRGK